MIRMKARGKPKVRQFDVPIFVDEYIIGLDIPEVSMQRLGLCTGE